MSKPSHKNYIIEYSHNGKVWGLELRASSFADAEERLTAIAAGKVCGEIQAVIPAEGGLFVKAWVLLANLFRSR